MLIKPNIPPFKPNTTNIKTWTDIQGFGKQVTEYLQSGLGKYLSDYLYKLYQAIVSPQLMPTTFAQLPPAAANEGSFAAVTDSTTDAWGAPVAGGGNLHVLVYSDGVNWTVMGK